MKIAVTGGTGFVGRHLVNRLLRDSHSITVLSHRTYAGGLFDARVRLVAGSVNDMDSLVDAFAGVDAVYHLVGIILESGDKTFAKTVAEGTRQVVKACQRAGVKQLIYLSALGTAADAPTAYHRTKFIAEQAVLSSGLRPIVFRASVIYGPGDGFVSLLTRMLRLSPITPVVGSGKYLLQPIYIDDLVEAMAKGLECTVAAGRVIDLAGPEQLEYVKILEIIKRVLHKKRLNFNLPLWLLRPTAGMMEKILRTPPLTRDQLTMLAMGNIGDNAAMKELFSIEPIRFEDGLRKYLR